VTSIAADASRSADSSSLPRPANGEWTYNASPAIQDNLVTAGRYQFAVWVDERRHPVVARRLRTSAKWEHYDLARVPGNPLNAPTAEDGHNFYSLAVDSRGYLHLSGNHHADPLNYIRSTRPWDITSWRAASVVGANEDVVTYPKFLQLPNRTLFFLYRDGSPGNGDTYLSRYDAQTQRWRRLHKLVDGKSDGLNFYPNHVSTRDGQIHIMGVWRGNDGAHTNRDVTYFRSADGGQTWSHADGKRQPVPVRIGNADIALETPATSSGLLNGGGLEVDTKGWPHGALMMYDSRGRTQQFHIWHDGRRWHHDPVTTLTHRMKFEGGFTDNRIGHPSVITSRRGDVYVLYRAQERGDVLRAVDVTPGRKRCEMTLPVESALDFWNPVFDTWALYAYNRVSLLVVPTGHPQDPVVSQHLDDWQSVPATVTTFGFDDFERAARSACD